MKPQVTNMEAVDYLHSLSVDPADAEFGVTEVSGTDGAVLYKAGSENHFVIMVCTDHVHKGFAILRKVIPAEWQCFYAATNPEAGFVAHHFGPVLSPVLGGTDAD